MSVNKPLTKAEEQVMLVLWKLGKGFLKDIIDQTPDPKPHSNTIATLLKILVEKGYVEYEVQGRNNCYQARVSKMEYGKKSAQQLVKGYGETHERGAANFDAILADAHAWRQRAGAADRVRALRIAALADDQGIALSEALAAAR